MKFFLVFAVCFSAVEAICPTGAIQGLTADSCYLFVGCGLGWKNADQVCQQKGGHLASVTNAFTNTFVQSIVAMNTVGGVWIGGFYEVVQETWAWADGNPWKYTNWDKVAANKKTSGNCISFNATSGQWTAADCESVLPYICEVPPAAHGETSNTTAAALPTTPKPCPAGWFTTQFVQNPLCYLTVQTAVTWTNASAACQAFGGQLASVTSVDIQEELYLHLGGSSWIGLYSDGPSGIWQMKWSDGAPLVYTYYGYPINGEPMDTIEGTINPQESVQAAFINVQLKGEWQLAPGAVEYYKFYYICEGVPDKLNT